MNRIVSIALAMGVIQSVAGAVGLLCQGYEVQVGHNGKYFTVTESDRSYRVGRESLDGTLKHIDHTNMARFLEKGRIEAKKYKDGSSYYLRGYVNGLGGGPVAAAIGYWGTKVLCYAGIITAGTAVVASGVGAGVAMAGGSTALAGGAGVAGAAAKAGIALGVKSAIGAGATTGASILAGGIASAGGTAIATEGTLALITASAGSTLGVVGTIESMALAAAAAGMALPTP